jgi:hypothetical protein
MDHWQRGCGCGSGKGRGEQLRLRTGGLVLVLVLVITAIHCHSVQVMINKKSLVKKQQKERKHTWARETSCLKPLDSFLATLVI